MEGNFIGNTMQEELNKPSVWTAALNTGFAMTIYVGNDEKDECVDECFSIISVQGHEISSPGF